MPHKVKRPTLKAELVPTGTICLQLGISQDYLKNYRQSGQLRQGIHWVNLPGSPRILWRIDMVRDWLYLKIGLRYLRGVINKGRTLLVPIPLFYKDPEPCFASQKAQLDFSDSIWFDRIVTITCKS